MIFSLVKRGVKMGKNDNASENFFPLEKKGYEKTKVDEYIADLKATYEKQIADLKQKVEELRDKNDKLTDGYLVLQNQKNEVATALINAEDTAKKIIAQAKDDAVAERAQLDEEIEKRKRIIVEQNEQLRQLRIDAESALSGFEESFKKASEQTKADVDAYFEKITEEMKKVKDDFSKSVGDLGN